MVAAIDDLKLVPILERIVIGPTVAFVYAEVFETVWSGSANAIQVFF